MTFVSASASELLARVTAAKKAWSFLPDRPYILLMEPLCIRSAALLLAAMELKRTCLLLPTTRRSHIDMIARQTGISMLLWADLENDSNNVVSQPLLSESTKELPWLAKACEHDDKQSGFVMMLTSGTTETAKVVLYTWQAVRLQAQETARRLFGGKQATMTCTASLAHAYCMNALVSAYLGKATLCLADSGSAVLRCTTDLPAPGAMSTNVLFGSPPLFTQLAHAKGNSLNVDQVFSAGSPLPPETEEAFRKRYNISIGQNYGTSETGNIALWEVDGSGRECHHRYFKTAGYKGVAWGNVRVCPPRNGAALRKEGTLVEEAGELYVYSEWQSLGYIVELQLRLHDHYHPTGDAGHVIEETRTATNGSHYTVQHIFAGRRLQQPITMFRDGLPMLVQTDDLESIYTQALNSLSSASATPVHVALRFRTDNIKGQAAVLVDVHVGVGGDWLARLPSVEQEERDLLTQLNRQLITLGLEHAVAHSLTLHGQLPTSPAGKLLRGELERSTWWTSQGTVSS